MRQGANSLTERLCARETGNLREHLPARFALPVVLRGGRGIDDERAQGQAAVMRLMLASARLVPAMAPRLALAHCSGGANSDGDEPLAVGQHPGHVSPAPDTDRGLKRCQSARSRNHRRVALLCVDCARPQALRLSGPVSAGMSYCLDIPTRHTITLDVGRCACHHRPW